MSRDYLAEFGVSVGDLAANSYSDTPYPKTVPKRVVHIDADFVSYQVSAETKDELNPDHPAQRRSFEDMCHNATVAADHIRRMAGASSYVCHLTPKGSDKGGRSEQAMQKPYQGNRKATAEKPLYLDQMRKWIGDNLNGVNHMTQEADDGLAQALYNATDVDLAVMASKDKDLRMVPGLHLNIGRGSLHMVEPFGYIEIDDTKSTKKVVGYGTKFFWAQVLMGDTADNIQGLPKCVGRAYLKVKPTSAYVSAVTKLRDASAKGKVPPTDRKYRTVVAMHNKQYACGGMLAYKLLEKVTTDKEAFVLIKNLWLDLERSGYTFTNWRTDEPITATQAMLSDMQLLWMRRNDNPNDVIDWIKEVTK